MKELWVEKYRPNTVKEYVVRDETQKKQIETWVKEKSITSSPSPTASKIWAPLYDWRVEMPILPITFMIPFAMPLR